jgi:hypothetical protein
MPVPLRPPRMGPPLIALLAVTASLATPAFAQSGAVKSGVRGRVVVAPELELATTWPSSDEARRALEGTARIRRPSGHGPTAPLTEPMPALVLVLEGARHPPEQPGPVVVIEGMRFVPGQVVLSRPASLTLENRQKKPVTVSLVGGETLASLAPGQKTAVSLRAGEHTLVLDELPFASIQVRVLQKALVLPLRPAGEIAPTVVEGGDYQLAFYHGARALLAQGLTIPVEHFVAIDAAISANGVVTVSIKDGDLQVAVPPGRAPAPPPPKPTSAPQQSGGSEIRLDDRP